MPVALCMMDGLAALNVTAIGTFGKVEWLLILLFLFVLSRFIPRTPPPLPERIRRNFPFTTRKRTPKLTLK